MLCPLLALSGHSTARDRCPLLGVKRYDKANLIIVFIYESLARLCFPKVWTGKLQGTTQTRRTNSFSPLEIFERTSPSHGENRGSSPLGSASIFNLLAISDCASVPAVSRRHFALRSFGSKIIFLWSVRFGSHEPPLTCVSLANLGLGFILRNVRTDTKPVDLSKIHVRFRVKRTWRLRCGMAATTQGGISQLENCNGRLCGPAANLRSSRLWADPGAKRQSRQFGR